MIISNAFQTILASTLWILFSPPHELTIFSQAFSISSTTKLPHQTQPIHSEQRFFSNTATKPSTPFTKKQNQHKTILFSSSTKTPTSTNQSNILDSYDVIVVGSGIGGLSSAAMLSLYGYKVAVFESHYLVGGCAHGFTVRTTDNNHNDNNDNPKSTSQKLEFHFDTGPSFFSGLNPDIPAKSSNPLRTILDAIGEDLDCIPYTSFGLHVPEGEFVHTPNFGKEGGVLDQLASLKQENQQPQQSYDGTQLKQEWERLLNHMKPLAKAVDAMPTAALRFDIGGLMTTLPYLPNFAQINPLQTTKLTSPFQRIINESNVQSKFIQNWMDLLCFCLSGLPSSGTITAEMAMMMGEFYDESAIMDCPRGGANSIIKALVRGVEKFGGKVFTSAHVEEIVLQDGKAVGVRLKRDKDRVIRAEKAVVSNLSVWDMFSKTTDTSTTAANTITKDEHSQKSILDPSHFPTSFLKERQNTPMGKSFMHVHIGFRATREELSKLQAHIIYLKDWEKGIDAEDNAALLSIPSVHDDSLAPDGYAVLHIYTPATEDYTKWEPYKNNRNCDGYQTLKKERSQFLFDTLDTILPDGFDIQKRAVVTQIGTPLTHERFLRRYKGSYGPAIQAGKQSFPFPTTPIENLILCGDSCFPGIGVPAVAGSGLLAAHSVSLDSVPGQLKLLKGLK